MKRWYLMGLLSVAMLLAALTVEAQQLGELYQQNGVRGIVVKLTPDGRPAVLMSIEASKEPLIGDKKMAVVIDAADRNDGRNNMAAIAACRAANGGSYPLYDWCYSLGEGWYLPAINEVYDAWIGLFGGKGALDNYNEERLLSIDKAVKSYGGEKIAQNDHMPFNMISSTILTSVHPKKGTTVQVLYQVVLSESASSSILGVLTPKGFGKKAVKDGKIRTLFFPPYVGGGIIAQTRAFYRLTDDAYAGGIYEAPEPEKNPFGNTSRPADTRLTTPPAESTTTAPATTATAPATTATAPAAAVSTSSAASTVKAAPAAVAAPAAAPRQEVIYANKSGWDIIICPGQDIQCRVIRIGQKEIEYKKAGLLDGPTYTISRKKAEKIIYSDGREEVVKISIFDFIKKQ